MKLRIVAVAAAALLASGAAAFAGHGNSGNAPGQMMHRYGSMGHPGASYWAHRKHAHGAYTMSYRHRHWSHRHRHHH